jgi:hypothetical protein
MIGASFDATTSVAFMVTMNIRTAIRGLAFRNSRSE